MKTAAALSRLGTETAFDVLARANALAANGKDIINLGIGQPDFKTPEHVVEAAVKALRDGHHGYTPANGILELREAVSANIEKYRKSKVNPDNIMIVPGGKVTMFFAIMMLGEKGVEIIYPNPGFPIYESVIKFSGAKPVPMSLHEKTGFAFDADEVLSLITPKTSLIILNSPSNPTGGVVPRSEMDKLANGLSDHPHVTILSDEIYARMLYDKREHVSLLEYDHLHDRVIMLDGWSKTYAMTGWRMGYGVWPSSLIDQATRFSINVHSCVNASAQFAGIAALNGTQDAVDEMVKAFDIRRGVIVEELNSVPGFSCPEPGGAFYAFPNITGTNISSKNLQNKLLNEAGVAIISGTSFGALGEGYLRFSYANSTENIIEAIQRVKDYLKAV